MRDQAKIDKAVARIEAAREELAKAQRSFHAVFARQKKIVVAEEAKEPMTLERALEARTAVGENEAGYKWLSDRTWKGAWQGLGLITSGYWIETGQTVVGVAIPYNMDDAKLDKLAATLESEVIPVLKPGALKTERKADGYQQSKVIDVRDAGCNASVDFKLVDKDGEWHLVDFRSYGKKTPIYKGDIRGALTVIKNNIPSERASYAYD